MAEWPPVVVGVDASDGTTVALEWAAEDARTRGAPLRLVHAYRANGTYPWFMSRAGGPEALNSSALAQGAADLVKSLVAKVQSGHPELAVAGVAVDGAPVATLAGESAVAAVVVLGSRRLSAVGSVVAGSLGCGVGAHARGPVVIVRGPAGDPAERAAVVVGVDGSPAAEAALDYAFDHADRYRVPLRAVLCWSPETFATMRWRPGPRPPEKAERWLSEATAGWTQRYPDVTVQHIVRRDHPAAGLVAEAIDQHLLVVGTRARHPIPATRLGSVAQGVLHHATCPVAVVPLHTASR
ncbi:MAG TPA: universal stress protein [Jatrophihabitans sp.]|jgi:nucleotide-binding universal stress UspA family protein|nr:universal stress protein [Jatrophihabitans sp.]